MVSDSTNHALKFPENYDDPRNQYDSSIQRLIKKIGQDEAQQSAFEFPMVLTARILWVECYNVSQVSCR